MGLTLVTDRTQTDVDWLLACNKKKWANMTASEQSTWLGSGSTDLTESTAQALTDRSGNPLFTGGAVVKGGYNYEDLNRVECAMQVLAEMLTEMGYPTSVSGTKTDWDAWDIATVSAMDRYIKNLNTLRNAVSLFKNITAAPPTTMEKLTYQNANRIEQILETIERWIAATHNDKKYSGEFFCGE